ncbi:MAG TPA: sigma 54-interacting transcriptional regulator [Firmicutes bacterium]|nr:sigma 54-interacting transcriptional regulator [Bacillota bacterium]
MKLEDIMVSPVTSIPSGSTAKEAMDLFLQTDLKQLPVVDSAGRLLGELFRRRLGDRPSATRRVDDLISDAVRISTDTPISRIQRLILKEGKPRLYVCDSEGRLLGLVTERTLIRALSQEYERSHLALAAVLNSMSEGVIVVDKESTVIFVNPAYTRILGVPIHSILHKRLRDVEPNARILRVLETGQEVMEEKVHIKSVDRHVVVNISPIMAGDEITGAVSVFRDMTETKRLIARLQNAEMIARYLQAELQTEMPLPEAFKTIVGESEVMKAALSLAARVAPTNATVLITGESGVGKELVARAIHFSSPRAHMPLICVDCASIPETLVESELFGYEEGAFTGARKGGKPGKAELAQGGTLFFDEVGDMGPIMQAKVLRLLQEREFERIGSTKTTKVDIRVIAATNRDLWHMVREGKFREDLYYRLNVVSIVIPPLRARKLDIPALCQRFLDEFTAANGKSLRLSDDLLRALMDYDWPGNVRELRNVIEHCAVVATDGGVLSPSHLPAYLKTRLHTAAIRVPEQKERNLRRVLDSTEREVILTALAQAGGNKTRAMQLLGISRRTFYKKLRRHGLIAN